MKKIEPTPEYRQKLMEFSKSKRERSMVQSRSEIDRAVQDNTYQEVLREIYAISDEILMEP